MQVSEAHIPSRNPLADAHLLIVDDSPANLIILDKVLKRENCRVSQASGGQEALALARAQKPDLILLDIMMPGMNGFEVCRELKRDRDTADIPVIFVTAADEIEHLKEGFASGGADFVRKPFQPAEIIARSSVHVENTRLRGHLESEVKARTAELSGALKNLHNANLELINRLSQAAELRDNETANHLHRMSHYSLAIARSAGLSAATLPLLGEASVMHDIGKIGIPDRILLKPGKLTEDEFAEMKKHPQIGADLLAGLDAPVIRLAATIALTHHEKYDGSGYPNGLRATEIPIEGRIVAIADVFDALTTARPYKDAWPIDRALAYLHDQSGVHFDPDLIAAFDNIRDEIMAIRKSFSDS